MHKTNKCNEYVITSDDGREPYQGGGGDDDL